MSGWGATIYKPGKGSTLVDIGTPDEVRKLISGNFPGIKWNKQPFAGGTAEFGTYDSGEGTVVFGMFNRGRKVLDTLDLEIRGGIKDGEFESICSLCGRNGWEFSEDDPCEEELEEITGGNHGEEVEELFNS